MPYSDIRCWIFRCYYKWNCLDGDWKLCKRWVGCPANNYLPFIFRV